METGSERAARMVEERKHALRSLDEEAIRAWAKEWDVKFPREKRAFEIKVHASRTHSQVGLGIEDRVQSVKWLQANCTAQEIKDSKAEIGDASGAVQLDFFGGK